MKYRYINPEVTVIKVTKEMVKNWDYKSFDETPVEGCYLVTYPDGTIDILGEKELNVKFKPSLTDDSKKKEMYKLCTEIIDQESMVDDDNAEELLAIAVESARKLRRLIN